MQVDEQVQNQKLLTTEQVADILQIDPESVRRYVRSGELPSIRLGNKWIRIKQEDLNNFIEERSNTYARK